MFRIFSIAAAFVAAPLLATMAPAQDAPASSDSIDIHQNAGFQGFRAEVQGARDWFHSQGTDNASWNVGGAVGFDGKIGNRIIVGPEFSYERNRDETVVGAANGTVAQKSYYELGASLRAGYLITPQILLYGTGGYVNDAQRKIFTSSAAGGAGSTYDRYHTDGYMVGAGGEYQLTNLFYVGAGYRRSQYDDHTHRDRVFLSAGVRFKP